LKAEACRARLGAAQVALGVSMIRLSLFFLVVGSLACGAPNTSGVNRLSDAGTSGRFDAGTTGAVCGNGVVEQGEQCDDGNRFDDDDCNNLCGASACGDGQVNPSLEDCDDGNRIETDACRNDCSHARCGDGVTRADLSPGSPGSEACDDANRFDTDACLNDCSTARCGDGILRLDLAQDELGYEDCDDGNNDDADDCLSDCTTSSCGDGEVGPGEACDDGNAMDDDACLNTCTVARCGDGVRRNDLRLSQPGAEGCDDANAEDGDACTNTCLQARCGDGITRRDLAQGQVGFEGCDDGNQIDDDACSNRCTAPACGNGQTEPGEACDDGNQIDTDGCRNTCVVALCGDGVQRQDIAEGVAGYEACDDGNAVDSDACLNRCSLAVCGDGVRRTDLQADAEGYEVCDDGNEDPADACASCRNTCALHANCPGAYQNNRCLVREFNACIDQVPCADSNRCQAIGNSSRCVQPCRTHHDCRTRLANCQTDQNPAFCWYSLCGAPTELSSDFQNVDNGRLGGACSNDQPNPMDGHCYEVSAGLNQWVGLCIEGGTLADGAACRWNTARSQDAAQCGGGLLCTGHDAQGLQHCRPSCAQPGLHGGIRCPLGSSCMPALEGEFYVYGCIPVAEQCEVLQRDSCGNDGRCAILRTGSTTSHCEPRAAVNERVNAGQACSETNQCPDGYYCNSDQGCRRVCASNADCDLQNSCQRPVGAAYGGCIAPGP
jgi:cysteine-rich repeat protein